MSFVHLKTYSEFSINQGTNKISDLVSKAVDSNMPAIAITESNGLFSAISFYKQARSKGLKPIIGLDITIEQDDGNTYQLTLLAKSDNGYRNLVEMNSKAYLQNRKSNGAYLKEEWLSDLRDVIVLSGAKQGLIGQKILQGNLDEAKEIAQQMKEVFGTDFYLELQRDGTPEEEKYMDGAVEISQSLGIAPVATHPTFFAEREHFVAHEARYCIANKHILFDMQRPRPFNKEMYFKSTQEMEELFSDLPQALENTVQIAKKCNITLELDKPQLPRFPTPNGENEEEYFSHLCKQGLEIRLKNIFKTDAEVAKNRKEYDERFDIEMSVIKKMGFPGYFLIVSDFINWAKDNDIPIGPGRGSGAGSLVAYAMGITDVNPLPYGLLFERFLNPERVSMPDFDIDMCQDRRGEIIEYVRKKYGEQSVCQIGTFTTMAAKAVLRDVGRTLNYPYDFMDNLAKMVSIPANKPITLKQFIFGEEDDEGNEVIPADQKLLARYDNEKDVKKLIDIALTIEGLTKNVGTHASGVLISPTVLTDFTSLYTLDANSKPVSQLDMGDVEKAGLVKFDFLGLKNLTIIQNTVNLINENRKEVFDLTAIPLDDENIFKNVFANGNTTSIFQFESKGMKGVLQKAKPNKFEEIAALNALFRPGPMDLIPSFVARKHGREEVEYPHPLLENMLSETYGIMIYQEQVMECAKIIGGYSLGGADLLRRAMGKKKPEEMKKQRELFVAGAQKNNISADKANDLFNKMESFAGYGFNKSHAVAYSLVAYQTAFLKYYYPAEFLTSNFNSTVQTLDTDKISILLNDCKDNQITVTAPDINKSFFQFKIEDERHIRYGLGAIKGVGEKAAVSIAQEREKNGPYIDFYDFLERVGRGHVNKRVMEALIKAGAFDSINENRAQLYEGIAEGLDYVTKFRKKQMDNVKVLGNALDDAEPVTTVRKTKKVKVVAEVVRPELKEMQPWDEITLAQHEKNCLGVYYSTNPYTNYYTRELNGFKAATPLAELNNVYNDGYTDSYIGALVEDIKWWKSKKGAFVRLSDGTSTIETRMYEDFLNTNKDWLKPGAFISAKVKMERKDSEDGDDALSFSTQAGFNFEQTKSLLAYQVFVGGPNTPESRAKFTEICDRYISSIPERNDTAVRLYVEDESTGRRNIKDVAMNISSDPKLFSELVQVFGDQWVKAKYKEDVDNIVFPEVSSKKKKNNYKQPYRKGALAV